MPHYDRYRSTLTKRSRDYKIRAKEKVFGKKDDFKDFIINESNDYGIIIETKYDKAFVYYNNKIIEAELRKDINKVCNQVLFSGDKVVIENSIIMHMIKRTSLLSRVKKDRTRIDDGGEQKNIAANINLAVIVVSANEPPLHPKFIDRYLMILQNSNIDSIICLNKCDLCTEEENEIIDVYRQLGIPVVLTSTVNNIGINELAVYLKDKNTIFVGNSGVGKSSLTNALMNNDNIKTNTVSEKSKKGQHTTTTSKYHIWDDNSSIIDTPGIRSLDVSSFDINEVADYFSEFDDWKINCKYKDCLHFKEPIESCLVKQGVEKGLINKKRYESYIRIIENIAK